MDALRPGGGFAKIIAVSSSRRTCRFALRSAVLSLAILCAQGAGADSSAVRTALDGLDRTRVFAAAHRGDWKHHPENSVSAVRGAIESGAEIVEIDVRMTKDGVLVACHDGTLDRTTDGKGPVSKALYSDIRKLRLREGAGGAAAALTEERMPTLEEILLAAKGKAMVNVDHSASWPKEIMSVARKVGMEREVILKTAQEPDDARERFGDTGEFLLMPILSADRGKAIAQLEAWRTSCSPRIYEMCFRLEENSPRVLKYMAEKMEGRPRIWINALADKLCDGHSDARGPEGWAWLVAHGATVIQTDDIEGLRSWLDSKGILQNAQRKDMKHEKN